MNAKLPHAVLTAFFGLLGCSTPRSEQGSSVAVPLANDLPRFELGEGVVPAPDQRAEVFKGQLCYLGTTCLTMDPRPFEPCLLSTRLCNDKAIEPLLTNGPVVVVPPRESRRPQSVRAAAHE